MTFTIPQNNSTPVGEKTIYCRIVSPSGQLLGNGGTFPFEGAQVEYTVFGAERLVFLVQTVNLLHVVP